MTRDQQKLYIDRARAYIDSRKAETDMRFLKNRADWQEALSELDSAPAHDDRELLRVARDLKARNWPGFWSTFPRLEHLAGWLRYRGKCVYCGADLIERGYIRHGWATTDYLLPEGKYAESDANSLNAVPACSACKFIKGAMDPSGGNGKH